MKKQLFITLFLPMAQQVERRFGLNPAVVLAQAALVSNWGRTTLSKRYNNFFEIGGYGDANEFWSGMRVELHKDGLAFRRYGEPLQSFMDYGRLITTAYKTAAAMSYYPEAFAREIAYSKYIKDANGNDRETYRKALCAIAKVITNNK